MQTSTVEFAVETKNGAVQKVGKSVLLQPMTNFKSGTVKWHEDRKKTYGG